MSGNYPDGVHEHTHGAPWNCGNSFECSYCYVWCYETEHEHRHATRYDRDAAKPYPTTAHGHEHELCGDCEQYVTAACEFCGEYHEQEHPERFTVCPYCAAIMCCDAMTPDNNLGGVE